MAYNNRRYQNRRYNRGRPRRNYRRVNTRTGTQTQFDWKKIAWQAAKGALAYSMTNSELKWYDETDSVAVSDSSYRSSLLRGIAQGDGASNFDGQSLRLKSLFLTMSWLSSTSALGTRIKWYVVKDTRPQTNAAVFTDVFTTASMQPLMNINQNPGRFIIMKSGVANLNDSTRSEVQQKVFLKFNDKIRFNSSAVPQTYDILLLAISDEAVNTPSLLTSSRLRYYDN